MSLLSRIDDDFKSAYKARETDKVSALRMVRAAIKVKEKDSGQIPDDDQIIAILKSLAKQRQDAAEQYRAAGRVESADKEEAELTLIKTYLPTEVDDETIRRVVGEVISDLGVDNPKAMGQVMKESLARLGAGADGKRVSQTARELLQH